MPNIVNEVIPAHTTAIPNLADIESQPNDIDRKVQRLGERIRKAFLRRIEERRNQTLANHMVATYRG